MAARGDVIFLHGLQVDALIGLFNWERQVRQTLLLDLELYTDTQPAADSDRVEDTLDYKRIARRVREIVDDSHYRLVESLAEEIARRLLTEFPVTRLRLRVNKRGAVRGVTDVGVEIERGH